MSEVPDNLHDEPEPGELIRQLWRKCEARLEPGELAAFWKSGTPPPHADPNLAERLDAARTLTLQAIDALYGLARYRPGDGTERAFRLAMFKCGPTVVDHYLRELGRKPTAEEMDAAMYPEDHLFPLPDGVGIRIDLAALFFPDLEEAAEGTLPPAALLRFAVRGPTPETTANLAPEAVQTMTGLLQEMRTLITEARNAPPVLEDWLALQAFGEGYRYEL